MDSFMTSVQLRTPRLNALVNDPHLHPSERAQRFQCGNIVKRLIRMRMDS
jgi:hypothetical protein